MKEGRGRWTRERTYGQTDKNSSTERPTKAEPIYLFENLETMKHKNKSS